MIKQIKVRRSLFGRPAKEDVDKFLDEKLGKISSETVKKFAEKYKINIEKDILLNDEDLQWKEANDAPSFYESHDSVCQPL